jgi:hypothetical protein
VDEFADHQSRMLSTNSSSLPKNTKASVQNDRRRLSRKDGGRRISDERDRSRIANAMLQIIQRGLRRGGSQISFPRAHRLTRVDVQQVARLANRIVTRWKRASGLR